MPTAAKLFSAIVFAGVAWIAALFYAQAMPLSQQVGVFKEICAMAGVFCGWFVMGRFAKRGRSRVESMGAGVRTSLALVVGLVLIFAIREMLERAVDGRYKNPMDALLGVFERMLVLGNSVLQVEVLIVLLFGGLFGGAVAHWAAENWN
jgi:Na+-translocating ferredoxin:NAD+ oxidoreductase RnfE subunit